MVTITDDEMESVEDLSEDNIPDRRSLFTSLFNLIGIADKVFSFQEILYFLVILPVKTQHMNLREDLLKQFPFSPNAATFILLSFRNSKCWKPITPFIKRSLSSLFSHARSKVEKISFGQIASIKCSQQKILLIMGS